MHLPPHRMSGAGQLVTHSPEMHALVLLHLNCAPSIPHPPQLLGSELVSLQLPSLHVVVPAGHLHTPAVQTEPAPQVVAQSPQYSVVPLGPGVPTWKSTQLPEQ